MLHYTIQYQSHPLFFARMFYFSLLSWRMTFSNIKRAVVRLLSFSLLHKGDILSHWKVEMWRSQSPTWRMLGKLLDHFLPMNKPLFHWRWHCKLLVTGIRLFLHVYVCACACWLIARWSWIPESHSEYLWVSSPLQSQLAWLLYPRDTLFPLCYFHISSPHVCLLAVFFIYLTCAFAQIQI